MSGCVLAPVAATLVGSALLLAARECFKYDWCSRYVFCFPCTDLKAFEQRLIECVEFSKTCTRKWMGRLSVASVLQYYSLM